MLAESMQEILKSATSWLPTWLQHIAQLAIYFAILTAMMLTPLVMWLIYAVVSTNRRVASTSTE
jgi:hypothetical protein